MKLKLHMKQVVALLCAATLVCGMNGCSKSPKENAAAYPGTQGGSSVVLNITSEPGELNHMLITDGIAESILRHTMSGLTRLDKNDNPVMDIAESWEVNEDNTVYTIKLRTDAIWSNGDPVTANDFYFSWVTQMKPETGSTFASMLYEKIKNGEAFYKGEVPESELGIKVPDEYTLEVTWEKPMPSAAFYFAFPFYLPMNERAYNEIGSDQYAKDAEGMVTNGPYVISEWVHDDHITIKKSDTYFNQELVKIPEAKLVMIGDNNTSLNAFMAGEIDLCTIYSEQIDILSASDATAVNSYTDGGSWYLTYNMNHKYLSNANMRRALSYAINTQLLLDNIIKDGSVAADGLVPNVIAGAGDTPYAKARGSLFSYDAQSAKAYFDTALSELGVTAEEIQLEILTTDTTYNQNQSVFLQQQWKETLGIDVEIRSMAWKAKVEAQQNSDYDMFVQGWGPSENEAVTFLEIFESDNPNNTHGYANSEYDRLMKEASAEGNPQKRQELFIEAEKILINDMAIGPLYFTHTTYACSSKLKDMVRTPFQLFSLTDGAYIQAN